VLTTTTTMTPLESHLPPASLVATRTTTCLGEDKLAQGEIVVSDANDEARLGPKQDLPTIYYSNGHNHVDSRRHGHDGNVSLYQQSDKSGRSRSSSEYTHMHDDDDNGDNENDSDDDTKDRPHPPQDSNRPSQQQSPPQQEEESDFKKQNRDTKPMELDKSGKIGGLEQDSILGHDWKIGFKIHFRRIELSR
jgi:hypothetical protein